MRRAVWLLLVLVSACTTAGEATTASTLPPADDSGPPVVFVALGGGETTGLGLADNLHQAWPQLVFADALPRRAVHVNLASPEATVAQALEVQVPAALELRPTLATVWLTTGDADAGTPLVSYEHDLEAVVRDLREAGARVLVATGPAAPAGAASVEPYHAAVERVVERTGAELVDLSALDADPDLGAAGHRQVAEAVTEVVATDPP